MKAIARFTLTLALSHQGRGDLFLTPSPLVGEGWGEGV